MKIGIIGYREFNNYKKFCKLLKDKLKELEIKNENIDLIVSGGCRGTDLLAKRYCEDNNIQIKEYLAKWKKFGLKAGIIRNKKIVNKSNIIIAYLNEKSKGTKTTINLAYKLNKKVYIINI